MQNFPSKLLQFEPFWGEWYLVEKLGESSYASVYKIQKRDSKGQTSFAALKWLRIPVDQNEQYDYLQRGYTKEDLASEYVRVASDLYNEIEHIRSLGSHSNIVEYEDVVPIPDEDGLTWHIFIKMELLKPLQEHFQEQRRVGDVIKLGLGICDALIFYEKERIAHRDIKPSNLFVDKKGTYKLGDFGLDIQGEGKNQRAASIYMAPELYYGIVQSGNSLDLYSLGLVMYELLNKMQLPDAVNNMEPVNLGESKEALFYKHVSGDAILPPLQGGLALAKVILKACNFDKEKRYQSAEEMQSALLQVKRRTKLRQALEMPGSANRMEEEKLPTLQEEGDISSVGEKFPIQEQSELENTPLEFSSNVSNLLFTEEDFTREDVLPDSDDKALDETMYLEQAQSFMQAEQEASQEEQYAQNQNETMPEKGEIVAAWHIPSLEEEDLERESFVLQPYSPDSPANTVRVKGRRRGKFLQFFKDYAFLILLSGLLLSTALTLAKLFLKENETQTLAISSPTSTSIASPSTTPSPTLLVKATSTPAVVLPESNLEPIPLSKEELTGSAVLQENIVSEGLANEEESEPVQEEQPESLQPKLSAEGYLYFEKSDGSLRLVGMEMDSKSRVLEIPASIDGKPVSVLDLEIPENYRTIKVPNTVRDILGDKLHNLYHRVQFELEEDNPSLYYDEDGVLISRDAQRLILAPIWFKVRRYSLPGHITKLGGYAFRYSNITHITLHSGVEEVGPIARRDRDHKTTMIVEQGNPRFKVADFALYDIEENRLISYFGKDTRKIVIEKGTKIIGAGAFRHSVVNEVILPSSIEKIQDYAFENCRNLKTIDLPDTLTTISSHAFSGANLYEMALPESLENIEEMAFASCKRLENLRFPKSLTWAADNAFEGTKPKEVWVYVNSYAEEYCDKIGLAYQVFE